MWIQSENVASVHLNISIVEDDYDFKGGVCHQNSILMYFLLYQGFSLSKK
jgi:hypothetical protein